MRTIKQFVDKDEIVLNSILVEFAEVALAETDEAVQKLEDDGGVSIAFGDCN
jgi:hypothetical protein